VAGFSVSSFLQPDKDINIPSKNMRPYINDDFFIRLVIERITKDFWDWKILFASLFPMRLKVCEGIGRKNLFVEMKRIGQVK